MFHADSEADIPSTEVSGARCVQRFDDSRNSAIHTTLSHFAAFFIVARAKTSVVRGYFLVSLRGSGTESAGSPTLVIVINTLAVVWLTTPPRREEVDT